MRGALRRFHPAALLCMGVGLLLSTLVAARLYSNEADRIEREFIHEIDGVAASIDRQMGENIATLLSIKALFDASEEVTRSEFKRFTGFLLARCPAMVAVSWVPRVRADEREIFERRARDAGLKEFQFTERRAQGDMVRAAAREEYYPVYYLAPVADNEAALAFDLASDPARCATLHKARDTGEAAATGRITLVQEHGDEWAVLVMVPIYGNGASQGTTRSGEFQGVVSGVFRLHGVLAAADVLTPGAGLINVRLDDVLPDGRREMLHDAVVVEGGLARSLRREVALNPVGGRQWLLTTTPSRAYLNRQRTIVPYGSFLIGLLMTGWLTHTLGRLNKEKRHIEEAVDRRTAALRAQGVVLERLNREQKQELAERRRLQAQFAELTDHEQRRLGQELHDSLGQQVAVASMMAHSLQRRAGGMGASGTRQLERLLDSIQAAQAQVRALSKGLLPVEIKRGGLKAALEELTQSVAGVSDFEVLCSCDETVVVGDNAVATHLYRIAQEGLRNALEHGEVACVTISLRCDDGAVVLTIHDDGKGFDTDPARSAGAGLSTMHHRAELINATFAIESSSGQGTTISCRLPVASPSA
jgi:signal transduction histidine kinase/sensor domain CHASE-containing protein